MRGRGNVTTLPIGVAAVWVAPRRLCRCGCGHTALSTPCAFVLPVGPQPRELGSRP